MANLKEIKTINSDFANLSLELTKEEFLWLKGNLNQLHLFSEDNLTQQTRLIKRGKMESTNYFLLPKELRDGVQASKEVKCSKIETKDKNIIIFCVPK